MKISFVIPAYNEEKTIKNVILTLKQEFGDVEIVVVDDGSTDNTYHEAAAADKVIKHEKNKGIGDAIATGVRNSSGEYCVIVDADGQHTVEQIKKVTQVLDGSLDAVFTQRTNLLSSGIFKGIGKLILRKIINFFTKQKFKDINSGLQAFKKEIIKKYLFLLPQRFSFSTATLIMAYLLKFNVKLIDIESQRRKGGKSKIRIKDFLVALFVVLSVIVIFEPLNLFVPLSLYSFYFGIISGIISLLIHSKQNPLGFAHFFSFSVIFFISGLISNQISVLVKKGFIGGDNDSQKT